MKTWILWIGLILGGCSIFQQLKAQEATLLVGTYTESGSSGIRTYRMNTQTGSYRLLHEYSASNPSFLCISPDEKMLYAVSEEADSTERAGQVLSFQLQARKGKLKPLAQRSSEGNHPCYISRHPRLPLLFAGNYSTGSLAAFRIPEAGNELVLDSVYRHSGKGPDAIRQTRAHVHAAVVSPDGNFVLVPDLGIDRVMIYSIASSSGNLKLTGYASCRPGAGPRHLVFHPTLPLFYVTEELTGTVSVFEFKEGIARLKQTISTVAEDYKGAYSVADIHISEDGRFLYVSNRAEANNLAIYKVDPEGILSIASFQPVLGIKPRNFTLAPGGRLVLVGNQDSHEIVIFKRDPVTGLLIDSGIRIAGHSPVCLIWAAIKN